MTTCLEVSFSTKFQLINISPPSGLFHQSVTLVHTTPFFHLPSSLIAFSPESGSACARYVQTALRVRCYDPTPAPVQLLAAVFLRA
jgi:hypothetical protein